MENTSQQDLRSALLADDGGEVIVEHNGRTVGVRPPTLAQQKFFTRQAKDPKTKEIDGTKLVVLAVIECTYVPGTAERVFRREDEEVLMNMSTDKRTIVGKVSRLIQKMMSEKDEEVEGFSEAAPTGS